MESEDPRTQLSDLIKDVHRSFVKEELVPYESKKPADQDTARLDYANELNGIFKQCFHFYQIHAERKLSELEEEMLKTLTEGVDKGTKPLVLIRGVVNFFGKWGLESPKELSSSFTKVYQWITKNNPGFILSLWRDSMEMLRKERKEAERASAERGKAEMDLSKKIAARSEEARQTKKSLDSLVQSTKADIRGIQERTSLELDGRIDVVKKLKSSLDFTIFSKAFTDLINDLKWPIRVAVLWLFSIGATLVAIPLWSFSTEYVKQIKTNEDLVRILPIVAIEILLIFFFRVELGIFNSLKAQKLQLKMRRAILQFVESYADFRKDKGVIEKVESMIFGNLMPTPEQIPPTFEILDQATKMAQKVKNPGG